MSEEHTDFVLRGDTDGVAVLTINRVEKFNAMNQGVQARLRKHLAEIELRK